MEKIWLIIKREFITRVRKRSFLIVTLLIPLAFAAMVLVPILIATNSGDSNKHIAVIDKSGFFEKHFPDTHGIYFKFVKDNNLDSLKAHYEELGYDGVLYIPEIDINRPSGFQFYSEGQASMSLENAVNRNINDVIEKRRMELQGIQESQLNAIHSDVSTDFKNGKEETKGSSYVAFGVGYASGFIIYFVLLLFGTAVMRGVMEEKVSRIAEVMISSVRPFQLMMGKIIGIAAVGLLQFLIWAVLISGFYLLLPLFVSPESLQAANQGSAMANNAQAAESVKRVMDVVSNINWGLLLSGFFFYFLGGYLFYSSLYAAVGSLANEDASEVQQMSLPVTLPIIIGIMIMIKAASDPGSQLAVWGSIIPFTSPIVMMARLPYGVPGTVPVWQLALSAVLLVAGFIFTTWMAGKIYRTGILMYGKKITLKEAAKWIFK
ncbi:ABC transporter permease [Chitinophaga vietnamensis]|uniref:ABC transporter permease n=1 Tax=Chitinophaga vietnamensis TaxID=2593957 RepID=UPI001178A652|nr:ABC transporter permease [Chitinophaga vietnamensis]